MQIARNSLLACSVLFVACLFVCCLFETGSCPVALQLSTLLHSLPNATTPSHLQNYFTLIQKITQICNYGALCLKTVAASTQEKQILLDTGAVLRAPVTPLVTIPWCGQRAFSRYRVQCKCSADLTSCRDFSSIPMVTSLQTPPPPSFLPGSSCSSSWNLLKPSSQTSSKWKKIFSKNLKTPNTLCLWLQP